MAKLSQKLSQKNLGNFRHTEYFSVNHAKKLSQNPNVKLNTCSSNCRKRTAGQSHESDRAKISSTEFFVSAEEICERRWSVGCEYNRKVFEMLYTVSEAAKDHLKVSRSTVYRLIRNGELQSVKVLGCTRITPTELQRFERMIGGLQ